MMLGFSGEPCHFSPFYRDGRSPCHCRVTLPDNETSPIIPVSKPSKSPAAKIAAHPFIVKWEKKKKIGYAPGPRVGCTMAAWTIRAMGILFGGVTDEDTTEESLSSVYHNDM